MNLTEWTRENYAFKEWYQNEYPFLLTYDFPVPEDYLTDFYINDIENRNLSPEDVYLNNYDLLFAYFLYWYPQRFGGWKAKTWAENTIKNLPGAIQKTLNQISSFSGGFIKNFLGSLGLSPLLLIVIGLTFVYFFYKK